VPGTARIRAACAAFIAAGALAVGSLALVTPAAQAAQISQGYYLFYQRITSIHANCLGGNHEIASDGKVGLSPYAEWSTIKYLVSTTDNITNYYFHENGFSTAYRQEWCRSGDYVYEYFGKNKVRRDIRQEWFCSGGGCVPHGNFYTSWKNYNWS
jgi:hypothetical protein